MTWDIVEINREIKSLLGCIPPALERLNNLHDAMYKLRLINNNEKMRCNVSYSKVFIFGYSHTISSRVEIEIDRALIKNVLSSYKEEYEKQMQVCEELIRKLKSE